ncbi:MAG: hypoxanthine phosphoribosyltransferase [Spirochaetia bacterium]|nr:hypoxanthine phosphoribosyltransferase [Spirochaetia bacterium]
MKDIPILFSQEEIANRVLALGKEINRDYAGKTNILVLSILKGSFIFTADLVRYLNFSLDLEFMEISSYRNGSVQGELLSGKLPCDVQGKNILIVEDIIDTGKSAQFLISLLQKSGVASIGMVALLIKPDKHILTMPVPYRGFEIGDQFVVGYGMDYNGKFRNLPYIGVV